MHTIQGRLLMQKLNRGYNTHEGHRHRTQGFQRPAGATVLVSVEITQHGYQKESRIKFVKFKDTASKLSEILKLSLIFKSH